MESIITQNTDNILPRKHEQSVAINKSNLEQKNSLTLDDISSQVVTKSNSIEQENIKDQTKEELMSAIQVVSDFMNQPPRNVNFSQAEVSGKTIVKIFDADSQELIKQFPSEKIINMAERISKLHQEIEKAPGLLIDSHV